MRTAARRCQRHPRDLVQGKCDPCRVLEVTQRGLRRRRPGAGGDDGDDGDEGDEAGGGGDGGGAGAGGPAALQEHMDQMLAEAGEQHALALEQGGNVQARPGPPPRPRTWAPGLAGCAHRLTRRQRRRRAARRCAGPRLRTAGACVHIRWAAGAGADIEGDAQVTSQILDDVVQMRENLSTLLAALQQAQALAAPGGAGAPGQGPPAAAEGAGAAAPGGGAAAPAAAGAGGAPAAAEAGVCEGGADGAAGAGGSNTAG